MPAQLLKCIDFSTVTPPSGPNPRTISGVSFRVLGHPPSVPVPLNTHIKTQGPFHGLDCGYGLEITHPRHGFTVVCMSLVHWSQPAKIRFTTAAGTLVGSVTLAATQNVAQKVVCTSRARIEKVLIMPPSDETFLLAFCFS
jgi:hypothetical protein